MSDANRLSLRELYLYLVCLVTLVISLFAAVSLVRSAVELAYPDPGAYGWIAPPEAGGEFDEAERTREEELVRDSQRRSAVLGLVTAGTTIAIAGRRTPTTGGECRRSGPASAPPSPLRSHSGGRALGASSRAACEPRTARTVAGYQRPPPRAVVPAVALKAGGNGGEGGAAVRSSTMRATTSSGRARGGRDGLPWRGRRRGPRGCAGRPCGARTACRPGRRRTPQVSHPDHLPGWRGRARCVV